ncbi:hypothetical protein [Sphingomonas flavalba]|uniref:hypothetical protein n=1 Tax=Sphingomonas flavalba TaxID=2559804 RepID=UPI001448776F|nr:hypothetical protein [Sphingomonas flavalba]
MKRRIVLTNESARHPFRQKLPPFRVERVAPVADDDKDLKLFVLSFTAFFIAIYSFIG